MADEREPLIERKKDGEEKPSTLLTVCPYILGNELCERLAYYGLATNLVTYIGENIGGNPAFAAILVAVFEGMCYTTPILGAYLADSKWGRYKTIKVFSMVYLVGMFFMAVSSWPPLKMIPAPDEEPSWVTYVALCGSLFIIAVGTGGIKPNVSAFGADQFDDNCPQDRKEKESFFNWFYLAINVGSFVACTVIVYIQDQVSWTIGFAVPGLVMLLAILLFIMGGPKYKHVRPTESPMARVAKVVYAALHNRYLKKNVPTLQQPKSVTGSQYNQIQDAETIQAVPQTPTFNARLQVPEAPSMSFRWLEDAVTEWQTSQGETMHIDGLAGYTPKQVEEVKLVLRLLPVFGATILYWTIYTQMSSMFVQQGNVMDRSMPWFNGETVKIPSASMSIFNTVSIIVLIYLYDKVFEPAMKGCYKITLLRRIGWGMAIAAVSMFTAAGVEWYRLKAYHDAYCPPGCEPPVGPSPDDYDIAPYSPDEMDMVNNTMLGRTLKSAITLASNTIMPTVEAAVESLEIQCLCGDKAPRESPMSIWWQAPQYILVGMSEVFTSIGQMEFFYDQAPDVMRSCSMALGLLSTALGSYMAGALTYAVQVLSLRLTGQRWLPNDLNKGRLDLFFIFMMILMIANSLLFGLVAVNYQYKKVEHRKKPKKQAGKGPKFSRVPAPPTEPLQHTNMQPMPTAAVAIAGRHPYWDGEGDDEPPIDIYGRSLAYVPGSPILPQGFR